jgi:hypothetical protein
MSEILAGYVVYCYVGLHIVGKGLQPTPRRLLVEKSSDAKRAAVAAT